jgi:hypothetical protein
VATVECPYPDCPEPLQGASLGGCRLCQRRNKACSKCSQLNRSLSRYCRACGERLPELPGQWLGFQAGADRRGFHGFPIPHPAASLHLPEQARLALRAPCRSLLFYEGFLLAVADDGTLTALEIGTGKVIGTSRVAQRATAGACISQGVLFVAGDNQLTPTPLASLARSRTPEAKVPVSLSGRATDSLLAIEGFLFVTTASPPGLREILSIEVSQVSGRLRLGEPRSVFSGRAVTSPVASSAAKATVFFLCEENGSLSLNHSKGGRPAVQRPLTEAQGPLAWQTSPATVGKKLFAVMGPTRSLCRINLESARQEERFTEDVRAFAVGGLLDGVTIQGTGLYSIARNQEETVHDSIKGSPLLWRELAVIVGLSDGRIQLRDVRNLAPLITARVAEAPQAAVTALAAYEDYLAAAAEDGTVKLYRLVKDPGANP